MPYFTFIGHDCPAGAITTMNKNIGFESNLENITLSSGDTGLSLCDCMTSLVQFCNEFHARLFYCENNDYCLKRRSRFEGHHHVVYLATDFIAAQERLNKHMAGLKCELVYSTQGFFDWANINCKEIQRTSVKSPRIGSTPSLTMEPREARAPPSPIKLPMSTNQYTKLYLGIWQSDMDATWENDDMWT